MEVEHKHQMELDTATAQNKMVGEIMASLFSSAMASPSMASMLDEQLKQGMKGGRVD